MATCIGMVVRLGALNVLKPVSRHFARQGTKVFTPSRATHEVRSSLYEHVREGYSDKPDLDMRLVCEDTDKVIANVETRKGDLRGADVREIVCVWQQLEVVRKEISQLEEQKKVISHRVRTLVDQNDKKALANIPEFKEATKEGREIRHRLSRLYPRESELEEEHYGRALRLPNTTHPDVPIGDESQARVVELVGQKPEFDFKPRGHLEIGEELGLIRQRGAGARLQSALQNFALETLQQRVILWTMLLTGRTFLSVCSSTCYRAETDTGRETWGLYRVHHFSKVEMFGVTADETGEESSQMLEEFLSLQKEIFSSLELHYRVLDMPTQELGRPAHRKYDIEAWMPGRDSYGEISSGSNCTDYQSRRLNILYEGEDGSLHYAHTVNATACAIPRTIIAILETHQTKEGTVLVPRALQPFLGLEVIEKPKYIPLKYIGPNQPNRMPRPVPKLR
ncbi:unnamed protein product [Coregonus sp. 'balchen']|nr:unnamed protein product [Coregonus sp. 'balchen']